MSGSGARYLHLKPRPITKRPKKWEDCVLKEGLCNRLHVKCKARWHHTLDVHPLGWSRIWSCKDLGIGPLRSALGPLRWKLRSLPKPQHAMWQFYAVMKRLCVFKGLFQDRPVTNSQKFWLQKTQTSRKFGGSNSLQVGDMKSLVAQVGLANDDFLVFWFAWLDGMTFFPILQSPAETSIQPRHASAAASSCMVSPDA